MHAKPSSPARSETRAEPPHAVEAACRVAPAPLGQDGTRAKSCRQASATYEARSMIVTTNIEFGKWGTVLGDAHLATATVDRIMHHGRLVEFGGQSRRFEEALMMGRSEK